LYDAGEAIARQLPAVLRALGRSDALDFPDFSTQALLTGNEIAEVTGLAPGKELGAIKRALLEAQIRGDVTTAEEAKRFVQIR
jgi:poly(A) polymerase